MQKHIFVGRAKPDVDIFYAAQKSTNIVNWAVPRISEKGDKGIFLLPNIGFVAIGTIATRPEEDGNQWTGWGARVEIIYSLTSVATLTNVQLQLPGWSAIQGRAPWKQSFTIDPEFFLDFLNILKMAQSYLDATKLENAFR